MIERSLFQIAFDKAWGRQMRFISGPRQSGKTTLAKVKLSRARSQKLYYLWDLRSVRERYKKEELFFTQDIPPANAKKHWLCFDEIHKMPKWKNMLKGMFDTTENHYQFIVTGSAKLNMAKRAGDSLSGRYFTFELFPLTLREVIGRPNIDEQESKDAKKFILNRMNRRAAPHSALDQILQYGGFPEPFLRQHSTFSRKWSRDYLDRVVNEDIGALTRIIDREQLYDLYNLLPQMVGSPLSKNSLAGHLETSPQTIKNYLTRLSDFYLAFKIAPYTRNIKRSLLKASKWYLYDWTRIPDPGRRFENYMAVELNTLTKLWTHHTGIEFSLFYIRDKDKKETDFLLLRERQPWLMVETKMKDSPVESHHIKTAKALGIFLFFRFAAGEKLRFSRLKIFFVCPQYLQTAKRIASEN